MNPFIFTEEAPHDVRPCSRAASARLPPPSRSLVRLSSGSRPRTCSTPMTATRPGVLSPPGSRPGSADPHLATVAAEPSGLTHGETLFFTLMRLLLGLSHPATLTELQQCHKLHDSALLLEAFSLVALRTQLKHPYLSIIFNTCINFLLYLVHAVWIAAQSKGLPTAPSGGGNFNVFLMCF